MTISTMEYALPALGFALLVISIKWLYDEATGKNYYKKYPIAKALDVLSESGELKGKDITLAIMEVDPSANSQSQLRQFTQNIRKQ